MAETVKHTVGPWTSEGPDCYGDFNIVPPHESLAIGAVVRNGFRPQSETEANARLIAAAPELLEALKALVEQWNLFEASYGNQEEAYYKLAKYARPSWKKAIAAIAKAEGGAA